MSATRILKTGYTSMYNNYYLLLEKKIVSELINSLQLQSAICINKRFCLLLIIIMTTPLSIKLNFTYSIIIEIN